MIENLDDAVKFYNKEVLQNEGRITKIFHGNKGVLAKRLDHNGAAYNHVVFYKKSWNEYFGRKFRKSEQKGQTTNLRILEEAATFGDIIGIVHPDTQAYNILAQDWLSYARKNGTIWVPSGEFNQEASINMNGGYVPDSGYHGTKPKPKGGGLIDDFM
jgi:hypothetical protein